MIDILSYGRRLKDCRAASNTPGAQIGISLILALLLTAAIILLPLRGFGITTAHAQMGPEAGSELKGVGPMATPSPTGNDELPAPIPDLHIPEPVQGSMLVAPPSGNAPLAVGFFVLASDPEGLGFLTYSWNFGDGTVSSLPPELYIFHTYSKPGTYVCELTVTTVDGRKKTLFQGVVVSAMAH